MASKAKEGFGFQLSSALVEDAGGYDAIKGFLKEVSERSGAERAERSGGGLRKTRLTIRTFFARRRPATLLTS